MSAGTVASCYRGLAVIRSLQTLCVRVGALQTIEMWSFISSLTRNDCAHKPLVTVVMRDRQREAVRVFK